MVLTLNMGVKTSLIDTVFLHELRTKSLSMNSDISSLFYLAQHLFNFELMKSLQPCPLKYSSVFIVFSLYELYGKPQQADKKNQVLYDWKLPCSVSLNSRKHQGS